MPTILLLTIGFVLVPTWSPRRGVDGTFAYQRALPIPRPLLLLADLTVWSAVALPGIVVALAIAWFRYDLALAFDWPVLVATAVAITVTATAVGYMIAVTLPPMLAQLVEPGTGLLRAPLQPRQLPRPPAPRLVPDRS